MDEKNGFLEVPLSILRKFNGVRPGGGTGRRKGLKIPRELYPVPVRFRPRAPF